MSNRDASWLFVIFVIGVIGIWLDGLLMSILLIGAIPVVVTAALIAIGYMWRLMLRLPEPRPVFFRMLLGADRALAVFGVILGYLAIAILGEQVGWVLPMPPRHERWALIALVVCLLLSPPIYHAAVIARERRRRDE